MGPGLSAMVYVSMEVLQLDLSLFDFYNPISFHLACVSISGPTADEVHILLISYRRTEDL